MMFERRLSGASIAGPGFAEDIVSVVSSYGSFRNGGLAPFFTARSGRDKATRNEKEHGRMTGQNLILLALKASVALSVFAIGLDSEPNDAAYLLRRPARLARSLLAMAVIMPVFAVAIATAFDLREAIEVSLVALAVSPAPPILPKKQIKAHGEPSYAIGLLVVAAAAAVFYIPVVLELLNQILAKPIHMQAWPIAEMVLKTTLAPLTGGMLVRRFIPAIASRIVKPVAFSAAATLIFSFLLVLYAASPAILALLGNGTFVAIAAFVLFGLAVGHMLGGPDPDHRTVLALATATRHPGIALMIGSLNFPEQKAVLPSILLYVVLCALFTIAYTAWRKRAQLHVPEET